MKTYSVKMYAGRNDDLLAVVADYPNCMLVADSQKAIEGGMALALAYYGGLTGTKTGRRREMRFTYEAVSDIPAETVLAAWRKRHMVRLHHYRAGFLQRLVGLGRDTLYNTHLWDNWTPKDLLPHLALWDAHFSDRFAKHNENRNHEIESFGLGAAVDAKNDIWHQKYADTSIENSVAILLKERNSFLNIFTTISDADLHRQIEVADGRVEQPANWARLRWLHDRWHTKDLENWSNQTDNQHTEIGPKAILIAALRAAQHELAAILALGASTSSLTDDEWTVHDMVGHLAAWEAYVLDAVQTLSPQPIESFDAFNARAVAERRERLWDEVWAEMVANRIKLVDWLGRAPEAKLSAKLSSDFTNVDTVYGLLRIILHHQRVHATQLKNRMEIS